MDLILWRHAEAKDLEAGQGDEDDMKRALTSRGEKQAARMAKWLDRQLPDATRVLVSPALRCEQTALALSRKYKIKPELAHGFSADDLLKATSPHWGRRLRSCWDCRPANARCAGARSGGCARANAMATARRW